MAFSLRQIFPFLGPGSEQASDVDLRDNGKIVELFKLMRDERIIVNIRFPDTDMDYSSRIVEIDDDGSRFALDEILPDKGNTLLCKKREVVANARVRDAQISFKAQLISAQNANQFQTYWCSIPDSINYTQRRSDYRVPVNPVNLYGVTAEHEPSHRLLRGQVHDISAQGIGIAFKSSHIIKPGDRLIRCQLSLSDNEKIKFTLGVCHIESTTPGSIIVGGSFMELDNRSRQSLSRFVRQMERAAIKS
ncbi:MAG: flagellar brake protein [Gammaproteobacteria bacterium]|jgi:c-di-GMP-binding flagellar brake protein YcgR